MNQDAKSIEQYGEAAARFAKAGGAVLMKYFRTDMQIEEKGAGNLVSEADFAAEKQILTQIKAEFPQDDILSEEDEQHDYSSNSLWIIDPLDGTNNFANGMAHFATSVAYYRDGLAQCGAIYDPIRDDLYVAIRGGGATRNGQPIHVSKADALNQCLVGTGFYYDRGEIMRRTLRSIEACFAENIHGIRRCGAATLDLCLVASGAFGAFFEYHLSPWDFAAGRLIVEEAGGKVTDCFGADVGLAVSSMLASNGKLHDVMLKIMQASE